jgi:arginine exporter protein ArgO
MADALIDGLLAGYGVAIPVGAIAVLIIGVGIRCGFRCGAAAGAGAATADLIYASVAAVTGTAAARLLENWSGQIKITSAVVLAGMAVAGLIRLRRPAEAPAAEFKVRPGELARTYARFLGLTIVNPLTVVIFTTIALGSGLGRARSAIEVAMFAAAAFAASLSWQLFLAAVGAVAGRRLPPRFRTAATVAGNLVVLALAARIAL